MPINRKHKRQCTQDGEAGFTLIEMIIVIVLASILGTFVFGILTKCLTAQRDMQVRKERSDDAILALEKISREVKEAKNIISTTSNILKFEKNITSSTDTNLFVKYVRNPSGNTLRRQSSTSDGGLPSNNTSGDIVAENITAFDSSTAQSYGSSVNLIVIDLEFADDPDDPDWTISWRTKIFPRNHGL